jgi:hypothetical protein
MDGRKLKSEMHASDETDARPLNAAELGLANHFEQLDASLRVEGDIVIVRVAFVEGVVVNPFEVMANLIRLTRETGAKRLRIEAVLANQRLYDLLVRRYGLQSQGGGDFFEVTI